MNDYIVVDGKPIAKLNFVADIKEKSEKARKAKERNDMAGVLKCKDCIHFPVCYILDNPYNSDHSDRCKHKLLSTDIRKEKKEAYDAGYADGMADGRGD